MLGTGGGLKKASGYFSDGADFFLYNADIYCDLDLRAMLESHRKRSALATLGVMDRKTSRYLVFDNDGRLLGWNNPDSQENRLIGNASISSGVNLAFSGIHVISPRLFSFMDEDDGSFSIIRSYVRAAEAGELIGAFRIDKNFWVDVGTPEKLSELDAALKSGTGK